MPTMTQERWDRMTADEKDAVRDLSGLHPKLIGKEGWRVEIVSEWDDRPARFYVGRSTGWRPCHLRIKTRRSLGGNAISPTEPIRVVAILYHRYG